jgi:hypothetical protein
MKAENSRLLAERSTARAEQRTLIPIRARFASLVVVAYFASLAMCLWPALSGGTLNNPPEPGDGQGYDMIAFTLSRGLGFGYFFSDPDYRAPYVQDNTNGKWDFLLRRKGEYTPTAYRPPALPVILSLIYRTTGRDFRVWRILEATLVAGAITLGAVIAFRIGGFLAAIATITFALRDDLLISFSTAYATEGIALVGVMVLTWSLLQYASYRLTLYVALAGLSLGFLLLARNIFVLWYPVVLVLVWWFAWDVKGNKSTRRAATSTALFLTCAAVIPLPWWIRNCVVLESFMPMGTQGGINLPHGYSSYAVASLGFWKEDAYALFKPIAHRLAAMKPIIAERESASFGTKIALTWIAEHPGSAAQLALNKVFYLWEPDITHYWPILSLGIIGLIFLPRRHTVVLFTLALANTLSVSLTYNAGDNRFMLPVHLIIYIAAGAGVQWCILGIVNIFRNLKKSFDT